MNTIRLQIEVEEDHIIQLPPEVPLGLAEVIVIVQTPIRADRRPVGIDAGKGFSFPDTFDDPLPPELQHLFDGEVP